MSQAHLNYRIRKQAGTIALVKHNDAYVLILRRFNQETGAEEAPEQIGVDIEQFERRKAQLLEEVDQINDLIADLRATKKTLGEIIAEASGAGRAD